MASPLANLWQQFQDLMPKSTISIVRVIEIDPNKRTILGEYLDGSGAVWVTDRLHVRDWTPPDLGKYLYIQDGQIVSEAPTFSLSYFEV